MNDFVSSDMIGLLAWVLGAVVLFLIFLGASKVVLWWLSRHPTISRVFIVVFTGLGVAVVAAIGATVFAFIRYGFRSGSPVWGIDRAAFIIEIAAVGGFILGALPAFLYVRRTLQMKNDHAA